jgi:hypothetical protein
VVAGSSRRLPLVENSRGPALLEQRAALAASDKPTPHAAIGASGCGEVVLRVECFGAVGRLASHASTSASSQARAFGVTSIPGGKPYSRISLHRVIREATTPRSTRSGYRISFTVAPHLFAPVIGAFV